MPLIGISYGLAGIHRGVTTAAEILAAYIDPNTGGMVFQVLAVLFGVISGLFLVFSGRIKGVFYNLRRRFGGSDPAQSNSDREPKQTKIQEE
jgi:hypothetical protein